MTITKAMASKAATLSKGLNREENLSTEKVVIWADGTVSLIGKSDLTRGNEFPVCEFWSPQTVKSITERVAEVEHDDL